MRKTLLSLLLILPLTQLSWAAEPPRCVQLSASGQFVPRACAQHDLSKLNALAGPRQKAFETAVAFKIFGSGVVPSGVPVTEADPRMQYAALFDSDPTPNPGCSPFDRAFISNSGAFGSSTDGAINYTPGAFGCGLYVQSGCFDYVQSMADSCFAFLTGGRSHLLIQAEPPFSAAFDEIGLGTQFAASVVYADGSTEVASDLCTGLEGISVGVVTRQCSLGDVNLQSPIDPALEAAVDVAQLEFDFGEFQGGPSDVTVNFTASPNPVEVGQSFTLSWSAPGALTGASCLAGLGSPTPWSALGAVENLGSVSYPAPAEPGTYFFGLTCEGPGNTFGSAGLELVVVPASTPSSLQLNIVPAQTAAGAVVTLSWEASGVTSSSPCSPGSNWPIDGPLAAGGSVSFAAPASGSHQYLLSCSGNNGSLEQTVDLQIAAQPPLPPPGSVTLVSQTSSGMAGNGPSSAPRIGLRGDTLVYLSQATDLTDDNASGQQAYARDNFNFSPGRTLLISRDIQGSPLPFDSTQIDLARGNFVAAFSNSDGQIRGYNWSTGSSTSAISSASGGALGNAPSSAVELSNSFAAESDDVAVFASSASNLVPGGPSIRNIYAKSGDGSVELISRPAAGFADGPSDAPAVSADGLTIAFQTDASNLGTSPQPGAVATQICLAGPREGSGRPRECVSRNPLTGLPGNAPSTAVQLSADGRFGVFESLASNLVADDSNGSSDIYWFAWDGRVLTGLVRISTDANGGQANGPSHSPRISGDGQTVLFLSGADNLVSGDSNGSTDLFIKHVRSGQIGRLSSSSDGVEGNGDVLSADLSEEAQSVAFATEASNLSSADGNGFSDIYQRSPPLVYDSGEPGLRGVALPAPVPANSNCPAGYFVATVEDGPLPGVRSGIFGMELLLNPPGSRELAGGLNFGGLVDAGQVGFAGVNIANATGEIQRLDVTVNGIPLPGPTDGTYPVRVLLEKPGSDGSRTTVLQLDGEIGLNQSLTGSVEVAPGYYVASLIAQSGEPGGSAEGVFYFALNTRFVDRPGGGFQGGAVVGGYHAANPLGAPSGFAAFCIADPYAVNTRVLSARSYGPSGAGDLRLNLLDQNGESVYRVPSY